MKYVKHKYGIGEDMKRDLMHLQPSILQQMMIDAAKKQQAELLKYIFAEILHIDNTPENVAKILWDYGSGRLVAYDGNYIGYLYSTTTFDDVKNVWMQTTYFFPALQHPKP